MARPTNEARAARAEVERRQRLDRLALDLQGAPLEAAALALEFMRDKTASMDSRVRSMQIISAFEARGILPAPNTPPEPDSGSEADTERGQLRAALQRLCTSGFGSDAAFAERCARNVERLVEVEAQERELAERIEKIESLKATYLAVVEDRPLNTTAASGNDAAATAPDPPKETIPEGMPPERTMLVSETLFKRPVGA